MNKEFENFDRTMTDLLKVSHSEIKAKLEAEKAEKQTKRKPKSDDKRDKAGNRTQRPRGN